MALKRQLRNKKFDGKYKALTALQNDMGNNVSTTYVITKNTVSPWLINLKNVSKNHEKWKNHENPEQKIILFAGYEDFEKAFLQLFRTKRCQNLTTDRV